MILGVSNHQLADFVIRHKSVFLSTVLKDESITHYVASSVTFSPV
jgi:hypothetical protein